MFDNRGDLNLKQKIFNHTECHKVILELINNSILIFENYEDYFKNSENKQQQYEYKTSNIREKIINHYDIPNKIIDIYRKCYKILSYFCKDNLNYQKILAPRLNLLIHNREFNIGQIEFLDELIHNNIKIATQVSDSLLDYICEMIKIHGKKSIFIDILKKMVIYPDRDNSALQKKVLIHLLDDNQLYNLNVRITYQYSPTYLNQIINLAFC